MQVTFYGKFVDLIERQVSFDLESPCTASDLRSRLAALYPQAGPALASSRVRICVDDQIVPDGFVIDPQKRVEVLAPVSGG